MASRLTTFLLALAFAALLSAPASMLGAEVVVSVPSGGGSIVSSPSGINCSSTTAYATGCGATFAAGSTVTLTANPAAGNDEVSPPQAWKFGSWGFSNTAGGEAILGCPGSTNPCTFTMGTEAIITASFVADPDWDSFPNCFDKNDSGMNLYRYCTSNCALDEISGGVPLYASIGYTSGGHGYCEGDIRSNIMSIGGDKTHSYTFGDPAGRFLPLIACYWRSSTAVWPSAGLSQWSSTITASNTITATRHWSYGARMVADKDSRDSAVGFNASGGPYCADESGCVHSDPCPTTNLQNEMPIIAGGVDPLRTAFEAAPSRAGSPVRVADDPAVTVRDRVVRRAGVFSLACPAGTSVLHADTAILGKRYARVLEPYVDHGARTAAFTVRAVPRGARVGLQVVCRAVAAPVHTTVSGHARGSVRGDMLRTTRRDQHIQAGAGADVVIANRRGAHVSAGSGADRVIAAATRVAVMGGPGPDRITSTTPGSTLIEGGPGRDVLASRRGRTVINAQDGAAGDLIICAPRARAFVVKDPGDVVRGSCVVRPGA